MAHVCFANGFPGDEFAGLAIEDVVESVAVGLSHNLPLFPVDHRVKQNRRLGRIPVMRLVRRELEIPFLSARIGINREQ